MDRSNVAARFVAFTYYLNRTVRDPHSPEEAGDYARSNWQRFLPFVHEELEELLTAPPTTFTTTERLRGKAGNAGRRRSGLSTTRAVAG